MSVNRNITKEKPKKAALYVRVSTSYQADKDSLPMQRQELVAYAKLMFDIEDYVIFEDAGYSGKNTDRPEFQNMMRRVRAGEFTHLLCWKIDRVSRNLLDFASMYQELKDLGVTFVSKNEQFDTSTAIGEAMLKIILVFAELERNMTSERVTASNLLNPPDLCCDVLPLSNRAIIFAIASLQFRCSVKVSHSYHNIGRYWCQSQLIIAQA